jgi:alpha-tubulin suppressor-like RCC1 family protein
VNKFSRVYVLGLVVLAGLFMFGMAGRGVPEDFAEAVRWTRLAAEQGHAEAQATLGSAYSNGVGVPEDDVLAYGRLGDGTGTNRRTPTLVSGGHTWASISAGFYHTVGITTSDDAYAWGLNEYGQLGDGTTTERTTPVLVSPRS